MHTKNTCVQDTRHGRANRAKNTQPFASTTQHQTHTTTECRNPEPPNPVLGHRVTAAIATGKHPDPSRTRKLSLPAPMVLPPRGGGRVGRRRTSTSEGATSNGGPFVI